MPERKETQRALAEPRGRWERLRRGLGEVVWPVIRQLFAGANQLLRTRLLPVVGSGAARLRSEAVKIHHSQNWVQRCSSTLGGNAAGLAVAMLSTRVVESMVETRGASNLWGLLADRPIVSESTFQVLSFAVEYLLALIVFAITEYYIDEYRRRRSGVAGIQDEDAS